MPRGSRAPSPGAAVDDRIVRLAFIAARSGGIRVEDVPLWADEHLGIRLSRRRIQEAVGPVRAESPKKQRRGRKGVPRLVKEEPLIHDGLIIDEPKLAVRRVLFRLANDGWPQEDLLRALENLAGVRQIIEVDSTRELLVIGLVSSIEDSDDLRARIEELAPGRPVRRDLVSFESSAPTAATWLRLAVQAVERSRSNGG